MMKVSELIKKLQQYPPEATAFVQGYEGGLEHIGTIKQEKVLYNKEYEGSYIGPYDTAHDGDIEAVILYRASDSDEEVISLFCGTEDEANKIREDLLALDVSEGNTARVLKFRRYNEGQNEHS